MKKFLSFIISGLLLLSPVWANQDTHTKEALDEFSGTETEKRLQQEFDFLEQTIAELQYNKGATQNISYVWNPAHTGVVFFSTSPPSGTYHCQFWAYKQNSQGSWQALGTYHFCTRHGAELNWENVTISIQSEGFQISFSDEGQDVSHYFSYTDKDTFYYRMTK